tara:strand:- start:28 stop:249 length:222 start_codon:yes stop_codon:yes gene_type:complete
MVPLRICIQVEVHTTNPAPDELALTLANAAEPFLERSASRLELEPFAIRRLCTCPVAEPNKRGGAAAMGLRVR